MPFFGNPVSCQPYKSLSASKAQSPETEQFHVTFKMESPTHFLYVCMYVTCIDIGSPF